MEAPSPRSRIGGSWTEQLLASRRGAVAVAAAAALLAGILLYLFVSHYSKTTTTPVAAAPTQTYVFVARGFIPQGTPASTVAAEGLLRRTQVPVKQALVGAISDPAAISGQLSATGIAAGQQITTADFTHTAITLGAYLTGEERAIAIPLDASHGLTSYLAPGDFVDIMSDGKGGDTTLIAQNVEVLANQAGNIVLRVSDHLALTMAAQSDNDKLWLDLRPPLGAKESIAIGSEVKN